jgi:hypothetical protein
VVQQLGGDRVRLVPALLARRDQRPGVCLERVKHIVAGGPPRLRSMCRCRHAGRSTRTRGSAHGRPERGSHSGIRLTGAQTRTTSRLSCAASVSPSQASGTSPGGVVPGYPLDTCLFDG